MNIALVEYGAGNLPSVERALARLGVESRRASTPEALASCDALILPGVGHFGALMRSLAERLGGSPREIARHEYFAGDG